MLSECWSYLITMLVLRMRYCCGIEYNYVRLIKMSFYGRSVFTYLI